MTAQISAFDYQHIKAALVIAKSLAKEIGTDQDIGQIAYATKLLEACEVSVLPTPDAWTAGQVALHGAE